MTREESAKAVEKFLEENNIDHKYFIAEVYLDDSDSITWFLWGALGRAKSQFILCMKDSGRCEFRR
jgi:hypothetical protein